MSKMNTPKNFSVTAADNNTRRKHSAPPSVFAQTAGAPIIPADSSRPRENRKPALLSLAKPALTTCAKDPRAAANFLSSLPIAIEPRGAVPFNIADILHGFNLSADRKRIGIQAEGLYLIHFGVTPAGGASPLDSIMLQLNGVYPIPVSRRPLIGNFVPIHGCAVLALSANNTLSLHIHAKIPIALRTPGKGVNAYITLAKID